LIIFGTRPEAIKMAPIVKTLRQTEGFEVKTLVTHQHKEMLDQVLQVFGIIPDFDLNVMKPGQDLSDITSAILLGCRELFINYRPDIALVHGDTTTAMASTLACFYNNIPVGHVEAGLRTNNIYSPYPEEFNRQLVSKLAKYHFAPTLKSKQNLLIENVPEQNILVTGNSVIDALLLACDILKDDQTIVHNLPVQIMKPFVLITGHRRENFGTTFEEICLAIKDLAVKFSDHDFIYPVHLNPNVRLPVNKILSGIDNIKLIEPLSYLHFVYLMQKASIILTDSGGIQEEAPSLGVPVLVMRETTERPEAIESGSVFLVGSDRNKIFSATAHFLSENKVTDKSKKMTNPYGDGTTALKIKDFLIKI